MKTILLADDDANLREELAWCLRFDRHRVLLAGDGFEAVRLMRTEPVDLAILAARMPCMNGVEVAAEMRRYESLERIPVLFLAWQPGDVPRDMAVVTKPIHPESLVAIVRGIVGGSGRWPTTSTTSG